MSEAWPGTPVASAQPDPAQQWPGTPVSAPAKQSWLGGLRQEFQEEKQGSYRPLLAKVGKELSEPLGDTSTPGGALNAGAEALSRAGDVAMLPMAALGDVANTLTLGAPAAAGSLVTKTAGTAASKLTGGKVSEQQAGALASMLIPFGGELASAADVARAAKAAGVSTRTMEGVLADMKKAKPSLDSAPKPLAGTKPTIKQRITGNAPETDAARHFVMNAGLNDAQKVRELRARAQEYKDTGAGDPSLLDVLDTRGQRVVRSTGAKSGDATNILEEHRQATRGDLSAKAVQRTEDLAPYKASVAERRQQLEGERRQRADTNYAEPYAAPIQTDERLFEVLNAPSGTTAIDRARRAASERGLDNPNAKQQVGELNALRDYSTKRAQYEADLKEWESGEKGQFAKKPDAETQRFLDMPSIPEKAKAAIREAHGYTEKPKPEAPAMPTISGGTLDRIKIALREQGKSLSQNNKHDIGSGVTARAKAIDDYLDQVPHLKEARADYKDYSTRIAQLDFKENLSTMRPAEFKSYLKDLTEDQRKELTHKIADDLAEHAGRSSRSAQSGEDVLTTGYNAQANLRELLGKDVADKYLRARDLMGQRLDKANRVAPTTGSQTAYIQQDAAAQAGKIALHAATGGWHRALHGVIQFIDRYTSTMTPEEARHIAEWAVQQQDVEKTLMQIAEAGDPVKRPRSGLPPQILSMIPVGTAVGAAAITNATQHPTQ